MDSASSSNVYSPGRGWPLATFTGRVYSKRSGGCWYVCVSSWDGAAASTLDGDGGSVDA